MTTRDSMLLKLEASANPRSFDAAITSDERATLQASDLQPDPFRARSSHATGPDRQYLGLDNQGLVVKTPLNTAAMSAHGLFPIADAARILQILVAEQTEVETGVITGPGVIYGG
jgi:hypothetical protein